MTPDSDAADGGAELLDRPETAAEHLVTQLWVASPDELAGTVLERVRSAPTEFGEALYVTDARGRLLGIVGLAELLRADPGLSVGRLMHRVPASAPPETDQERAASIAIARGVASLPVVEPMGRSSASSRPRR